MPSPGKPDYYILHALAWQTRHNIAKAQIGLEIFILLYMIQGNKYLESISTFLILTFLHEQDMGLTHLRGQYSKSDDMLIHIL